MKLFLYKAVNSKFARELYFDFITVCCKRFQLESNGPAQNTQKSRFGLYIPSSPAKINNHDSYKHENGHASIMYHSIYGWRVI